MEVWHRSEGTLHYSNDDEYGYRLVVMVDPEIARLARALTPMKLNQTRYPPHISVVRHEVPPDLTHWGKTEGAWREGGDVLFTYSPHVYNDEKYYWLNVQSPELKLIRIGLGLPSSSIKSRPPDGTEMFHMTIGNTKAIS